MKTRHIGRIVAGCLIGGVAVALALILGPVAGAQEHVITGTVLLTFAASWALLATLSMRWTDQPQRWAFAPAAFMGVTGAALLVFAPNGEVVDALGWVWPPLFLCTACWNGRSRPSGSAQPLSRSGSCTRCWVCTRSVLWEAATKRSERRSTPQHRTGPTG